MAVARRRSSGGGDGVEKAWKPTSTMHCAAGREGEGLLLLRERA